MGFAAAFILILAGISAMLINSFMTKKTQSLTMLLEDFSRSCHRYEATVLDVHEEAVKVNGRKEEKQTVMIVQFRIEEQKRTVVHRCTESFYRDYRRGDKITLLFREGKNEDVALIEGDNSCEHIPEVWNSFKIPVTWGGGILGIIGIIMLIFQIL